MAHSTVDYDPKSGNFIIITPPWNVARVRDIPSRRFDPKTKKWKAPATRVNAQYMEMVFGRDAEWTRLALAKLSEVKESVGKMIAPALPLPIGYKFKTEPMRTQRIALERAFGRSSFAYFKDMGTGKSKTFIDLACMSRMHPLIDAAVMVCPVALRKNWLNELQLHCPFPYDVYVLNSDKPKEFEAWLNKKHDFKWLIVGVESLGISARPYEMLLEFLRRFPRTILGVDEATKIKNHKALRSQRMQVAARHAAIRIVMTGTPIAKGVMDLYGYFEFMDPDILGVGDFFAFRNRYAEMGGYENKEIIGYKNMDELMEIVTPFVYQVLKAEALPDLPPKVRTMRHVMLSPDQSKHYKTMARDKAVRAADGREKRVENALEKALRLRQITSNLLALEDIDEDVISGRREVRLERIAKTSPKIADLMDFLEEFDKPMIIWTAFRAELDDVATALREKFGHDQVVELHGGIEEDARFHGVNVLFQGGHSRFVVAMAAVGAMGLTMTRAECEFYMSNTHSFIDREQSEDRAHRKGQVNSVLYVDQIAQVDIGKGVTVDTIDMHVYNSNMQKKNLSDYVREEIARLEREGVRDLAELFGLGG
jgi:SNF2 family DNA or RNA helicase